MGALFFGFLKLLKKCFVYLFKNPKVLGLLIVAAVIGGLGWSLWLTRSDLQAANQKIASLKAERDTAVAALNKQNEAIDLLRQAKASQAEALAEAADRAQQVKVVYRDRVKTIEKAVVPKECKAAVDWARDQALDLSESWGG
ncbi:MAG TPA: hypothetical protein VFL45_08340 [Gammaproteobacteria bacterium]|nr:hypothetical protein [Gammaproteobacteria bacterium]